MEGEWKIVELMQLNHNFLFFFFAGGLREKFLIMEKVFVAFGKIMTLFILMQTVLIKKQKLV